MLLGRANTWRSGVALDSRAPANGALLVVFTMDLVHAGAMT